MAESNTTSRGYRGHRGGRRWRWGRGKGSGGRRPSNKPDDPTDDQSQSPFFGERSLQTNSSYHHGGYTNLAFRGNSRRIDVNRALTIIPFQSLRDHLANKQDFKINTNPKPQTVSTMEEETHTTDVPPRDPSNRPSFRARGRGRGRSRTHSNAKRLDNEVTSTPRVHGNNKTDRTTVVVKEVNPWKKRTLTSTLPQTPKTDEDKSRRTASSNINSTKNIFKGTNPSQRNSPNIVKNATSPPLNLSQFQRLPAELRWKIYEHIFEPHRVEIRRLKDKTPENNTKRTHYRLYSRQQRPRRPKTQVPYIPHRGFPMYSPLPLALIFTCRSTYRDTLLLLYSTTQFIFKSTRAVAMFLKVTSKDAQAAIRHVELNHIMYNEPRLTAFRGFKNLSDMAWYNVCDDMSLYFKSLSVLHVDLTIWDWPIRLEVGERWSLPLLLFARYGGRLDYTNIQLSMSMFKGEKLKTVARELEMVVMKPEAYQIREDERLARELMCPVKAARVLNILF